MLWGVARRDHEGDPADVGTNVQEGCGSWDYGEDAVDVMVGVVLGLTPAHALHWLMYVFFKLRGQKEEK